MTSSVRAPRAASRQVGVTMLGRSTTVWLGLILMLAWPASGRAQAVEGVVRHQTTGDPLPGVLGLPRQLVEIRAELVAAAQRDPLEAADLFAHFVNTTALEGSQLR